MSSSLVIDTNIILDVLTENDRWYEWSSEQLALAFENGECIINPIVWTEVSVGIRSFEDTMELLEPFTFEELPREALFLAGKVYLDYRRNQGQKTSVLPDFFIGAHAAVTSRPLLTRDSSRLRTYFPKLKIISPG